LAPPARPGHHNERKVPGQCAAANLLLGNDKMHTPKQAGCA